MNNDPTEKQDLSDELNEIDERIAKITEQLNKFGTPSAGGNPTAARQRFIALYNTRRKLRQQLQDDILAACDGDDTDDIDAELERPQYDEEDEI